MNGLQATLGRQNGQVAVPVQAGPIRAPAWTTERSVAFDVKQRALDVAFKAGFNPDEPRGKGGKWTRTGGAALRAIKKTADQYEGYHTFTGKDGNTYHVSADKEGGKHLAVDDHDKVVASGRTIQHAVDALDDHVGKKSGVDKTAKRELHPGFHPATAKEIQQLRKGEHPSGFRIVIPPAWTNVEISNDLHHVGLQVRGKDSMGNTQPLYHPEHTRQQAEKKFQRIKELHKHLDKLDAALERDAPKNDTAAALLLSRKLGMRNSSKMTKKKKAKTKAAIDTYGATTIEARHVRQYPETGRTTFDFVGKKGKQNLITTRDPQIYKVIERRMKGKSGKTKLFDTSSDKTLEYLHEVVGNGFKVHDLRTTHANTVALGMLSQMKRKPQSKTEFAKIRNAVADEVAHHLQDTRTVALNSYIDPTVFTPLWDPEWGEQP